MLRLAQPMRIAVFAVLVACVQFAAAQDSGGLQFDQPTSQVACLTPAANARGAPEYPKDELLMKAGARVRVQLVFTSPDWAPRAKILENTGERNFAESVEQYVERYRLPCLVEGGVPVTVNQEFSFEPGDGRKVSYGSVKDEADCCADLKCTRMPKRGPTYPRSVVQQGIGGNVLAQVTFARQDQEPSVRIIYDARNRALADAVQEHMKQYRFVCPLPGGKPVSATQHFAFRVEGSTRYAFNDLELKHFLGLVDAKDWVNGKFDFNTMGCPFDLAVTVRRPYAANVVGEYGGADPRRKQFVNWISGLTVKLPKESEPYLVGQTMKVSVPCLVLDL